MKQVANDEGLVDVKLELAVHAADGASNVVAHDLSADHSQGLALGRVDLAGHDGAARLVLGQDELAEAATGAAAEVADVLGNLGERGRKGVKAAMGLHDSVVRSKSLELVGGSLKLSAGHLADLLSNALGEALEGVDTGADSSAALGEQAQVGKGALNALDAEVELSDVSAELLGQGKGGGVLEMSAADLDNLLGLELVDLLLEGLTQAAQRGKKLALDFEHGGDVHDSREGIVGRGGAVDVVIGVHRLLGAHLAAEDLNGAVADDLVGVHVGLGAGAGLPDNEGEVVKQLEVSDLLSSLLDSLADSRVCIEDARKTVVVSQSTSSWRYNGGFKMRNCKYPGHSACSPSRRRP